MLPLIATEARLTDSGEYASILAAKRAGAWVDGTRILANVTKESFASTEGDDLGKNIDFMGVQLEPTQSSFPINASLDRKPKN